MTLAALLTVAISAILGAAISSLIESALKAHWDAKAERATPTLARLEDVLSWGWDGRKLLKVLIPLDRRVIGADLTDEREGTVDQWAPVFMANPECWVLLVKGAKHIVGYWDIAALREADFQRAKSGEFLDSEVTLENIEPLDIPGVYNLYFVLLGVLPDCPGGGAKLIDAFFDHLEALANRGVFFREACANAFTKDGRRICEGFGMTPLGPHKDFGTVYHLPFHPWPVRLRHKRWRTVAAQYQHAFAKPTLGAPAAQDWMEE